jgi:hypothetical protein
MAAANPEGPPPQVIEIVPAAWRSWSFSIHQPNNKARGRGAADERSSELDSDLAGSIMDLRVVWWCTVPFRRSISYWSFFSWLLIVGLLPSRVCDYTSAQREAQSPIIIKLCGSSVAAAICLCVV